MAELTPVPFGRLAARMLRELELEGSIFGLPRRLFHRPSRNRDFSVRFHGRRAGSPLGPAAGPHTQLAQNIVLSWLAGARIIELKTVQVLDRLRIPRPCIDMRGPGYNVEWSQELTLEQSLEEYVKASMLIDMLRAERRLGLSRKDDQPIFDMSVGYDLKGLQSAPVQTFMRGLLKPEGVVNRLRAQIPHAHREFRRLEFTTPVSDSLTLSTFHGCPPGEIEAMAAFALERLGLHCTVKLNPTLLGAAEVRGLLESLGYADVKVPDAAFEKDAAWEQVTGFAARLRAKAKALRRGFGVKFANTLVVENRGGFLPASEKTKYLSGPPLHVLAIQLVRKWRREFGDTIAISFSGGIDRRNFPDVAALGLVPVTVCSDLLAPGGYGRLAGYYDELGKRLDAAGAESLSELVEKSGGQAGVERYADAVLRDPRYARAQGARPPKKVGSRLALFDCLTCDKCLTACPNGALFAWTPLERELPKLTLWKTDGHWRASREGVVPLSKKHQIACFADLCNECGNCDVFCPEDGGPYRTKPRLFGSLDAWFHAKDVDGFYVEVDAVHGRFGGREYRASHSGGRCEYSGPGFLLTFRCDDLENTAAGEAAGGVDMSYFHIMRTLRLALFAPGTVNHVNS